MSNAQSLYWLSFCDPDMPKGHAFLGVAIVHAFDFEGAVQEAWNLGINPGGEVMGFPIPSVVDNLVREDTGRLLSKEKAETLSATLQSALSVKH